MTEVRLIDANALAESDMAKLIDEYLYNQCNLTVGFAAALMPEIEAEPVRHGRWIALEGWFNKSIVKCSVCGNTLDMDGVNAGRGDANFCPNCGARMYGGAENG